MEPRRQSSWKTPEGTVAFACQECEQSIAFPRERCGHVEICPSFSMPLLVILALGKQPWSLYGIVRPKYVIDVLPASEAVAFVLGARPL